MTGAPAHGTAGTSAAAPRTSRRLLDTRLGQLHVRLAGATQPGGPPPLVLLHMSPLTGRMFDCVLPALAAGRLVVLPDRIGFGQSDRLAAPVPFHATADATADALDSLGIAEFDVFGMHAGACEAVEHAVARPERVRRVGVAAVPVFTPHEIADLKVHTNAAPTLEADGSHLVRYWERWQQAETSGQDHDRPAWSPELRWARVREHLIAGPDVWWTYHAMLDYPIGPRLAEIAQPFLVLAPHDDLWAQTERALPLLPPQATVVDMPHGDSQIFTLNADEVAGHLVGFFA